VLKMEPFRRSFGPNSGPSREEPDDVSRKTTIPPGSFYLIVDELDYRGMNSLSLMHGLELRVPNDIFEDHSRQPNAARHDRCQARRWPADILLPGKPHGRNDRRGNDQCRSEPVCHALCSSITFGPFLFLVSDSPPYL
jgi:hypothetical protein